jgi:hypothetical protein
VQELLKIAKNYQKENGTAFPRKVRNGITM